MNRGGQAGQRVRVALAPELTPLALWIQRYQIGLYMALSIALMLSAWFGNRVSAAGFGGVVDLWQQATTLALSIVVFVPMLYLNDDDRPLFNRTSEDGHA